MFKNCDESKIPERDRELENVKQEMEELKKDRINKAKMDMKAARRKL